MKPFLKWVGGKTQIIDKIIEQVPDNIINYYEPFLGGGSVLLAVLSSGKVSGNIVASDLNVHLINLYRDIQVEPDVFIKNISSLVDTFKKLPNKPGGELNPNTPEDCDTQESYYYWIRKQFNSSTENKSAMFLFLNKTCFRGVYREGPNGFNVPFGHNKNPEIFNEVHIQTISKLVKHVKFVSCSFTETLKQAKRGDFVYLDPPYAPATITSFVGYTSKGFSGEDHQQLFEQCKKLKSKWLMSNAHVPLVTQTFEEYPIKVLSCRRTINSKNPESRANEVLVQSL
jgi:DNA adenine methylase